MTTMTNCSGNPKSLEAFSQAPRTKAPQSLYQTLEVSNQLCDQLPILYTSPEDSLAYLSKEEAVLVAGISQRTRAEGLKASLQKHCRFTWPPLGPSPSFSKQHFCVLPSQLAVVTILLDPLLSTRWIFAHNWQMLHCANDINIMKNTEEKATTLARLIESGH